MLIATVGPRVLAAEQAGIEAADVAPTYWQHVHNRLLCGEQPRLYARDQHRAWLLRRRKMTS